MAITIAAQNYLEIFHSLLLEHNAGCTEWLAITHCESSSDWFVATTGAKKMFGVKIVSIRRSNALSHDRLTTGATLISPRFVARVAQWQSLVNGDILCCVWVDF